MRHSRLTVLTALEAQGVCPVFYHPDPEVCLNVIRASARGGARAVEFTNRGDFAVDLFGEIARELQKTDPDIILGIGSIVDAGTAALYLNLGRALRGQPLPGAGGGAGLQSADDRLLPRLRLGHRHRRGA